MASLVLGMVGQSIGGSLGGAFGAQLGWVAGSMLGSYLFAEDVHREGPRLDDLKATSSAYGAAIPKVYGTSRIAGNIIWSPGITETAHTQSSGGKGGSSQSYTSYTYSASFAVGLCEGPITGIRRIWANGNLIYNKSTAATADELSVSDQLGITIYTGSDDQDVDPLIEADKGTNNTPAYRGLAYIVFDTLQLEKYGNRIPNITCEVVSLGTIQRNTTQTIDEYKQVYQPHNNSSFSGKPYYVSKDKVCFYVPQWSSNYPPTSTLVKYVYENGAWTSTDISIVDPGVPPNAITDDPDLYWTDREGPFTDSPESPTFFTSSSGHIYTASNVNVAVHNIYNKMYMKPNTGPTVKSGTAYEAAICHYNGYIYSINIDGDRIRKYDMNFNQVAEYTMSSLGTLAVASAKLFPDNGYIYVMPVVSAGYFYLYRIDIALSNLEYIGYMYLGVHSGSYYNIEFNMDNSYLTAAWGYSSPYYPNHISIVQFNISETITSLAIDTADILDDLTNKVILPVNTSSVITSTKGYIRSKPMTIRAAIEPILKSKSLIAYESDYTLNFKPKDGSVDETITLDELNASIDEVSSDDSKPLEIRRLENTEMPRRVLVAYTSEERNYDPGIQYAKRINKNG